MYTGCLFSWILYKYQENVFIYSSTYRYTRLNIFTHRYVIHSRKRLLTHVYAVIMVHLAPHYVAGLSNYRVLYYRRKNERTVAKRSVSLIIQFLQKHIFYKNRGRQNLCEFDDNPNVIVQYVPVVSQKTNDY